ncbi:MAG TPA: autotransporter assembly complex family protein [Lysobacter sp.]
MRPPYRLLATAVLTIAAAGTAQAAKVTAVDIRGLDEAKTLNVRGALSLVQAIGKDLSGRRLGYLVREADDETREALEPFGYYSPKIEVTREGSGDATKVIVTVSLDEPVRVRRADIAIIGDGSEDRYLKEDLAAFRPQTGDVFDHSRYEASKTRITRRLAERGYFDADFASRRVEVTRAQQAADIDLVWTSGGRYDMGPITFVQTPQHIIRDSLLERLVYWEQGSYYHQGKLDRFRESLARLDYFSTIEIEPDPEKAVDNEVPVLVTLTPAKRTVYTAGVSYGTDSGAGVRLGMERRYVNDRGHKALGQIDWNQKRKTATAQYRIPAFAWLDGWYTFSAQYYDEQSDYIDTRKVELVASRSGQVSRRLNAVASIHALRERWAYVSDDDGDASTPVSYRYATFLYPSLRGEYIDADDKIFPRKAIGITLEVRGGLEGVGSDANFLQTWGVARWYHGMGAYNRLIVRGEAGGTFTNALVDMPPSLRFFAGGDRSIRGYAFREVGPTTIGSDGKKYALGAKNVLTGSVEFEHYFNDTWGAAGFVDAGDAFDDTPDIHTGVGFGARWKSPVGPVRFDIAHGLNDPDSDYEIYLNIGADW